MRANALSRANSGPLRQGASCYFSTPSFASIFISFIFLVGLLVLPRAEGRAVGTPSEGKGWTRSLVDGVQSAIDSQPYLSQLVRDVRRANASPLGPPNGGHNCTKNETCNHGWCMMDNTTTDEFGYCVCQAGYMGDTCHHEQKSLKTAFLLSFLLGNIGADRLYLGYVGSGVAKLLINLFLCVLPCCPLCYMCRSFNGGRGAALSYSATVFTLFLSAATVWLWWIVDWTLIVTAALPDESGYPLYDDL